MADRKQSASGRFRCRRRRDATLGAPEARTKATGLLATTTGPPSFGVSEFGINELILLPAHNFLGIVAIFGGLFSFAAGPGAVLLFLPLSIGFFVYVKKRHKKVRRAIESALEEIKLRESAHPRVGDADLDFRVKTP